MTSERRRFGSHTLLLLLARPAVAAIALPSAALLGLLGWIDTESGAVGAASLAAAIGAASLLSLGALALREGNALAIAKAMGLLRHAPFPFFAVECAEPARAEQRRRRWQPALLPALLATLALALTGAALALSHDALRSGTLELYPGETVEHWQAAASTDARLKEHLGVRATLVGIARARDGAYVARVRFTELNGQRSATVDLRSGESVRVRGHRIGLGALVQSDRPGLISLRLQADGLPDSLMSIAVGTRREITEDLAVSIPTASWARLGSLGPAAQIIVEQAGEVIRDTWVYLGAGDFDTRHAATGPAIVLERIEPATGVVLDVSRSGSIPWMTVVSVLSLLPALLLLLLLLRSRVLLRGRDGDGTLIVVGGNLRAERAALDLLPPALTEEARKMWGDPAAGRGGP